MNVLHKFKTLGPKLFVKKLVGYDIAFSCAIRKREGKLLYEGNVANSFSVMPLSDEFWYADPLFWTQNDRTFVFMEAFNIRSQKGEIVCSEIVKGKFGRIRPVIQEDYHMSFPNIFRLNGALYMLPETEASGGIHLYRCVEFPDKWEKIFYHKTQTPVVDSIVVKAEANQIRIQASTYDEESSRRPKFFYYQLDLSDPDHIQYREETELNNEMERGYDNRNAGRFIKSDGKNYIHCVQRSTEAIYGYSLRFIKSVGDEDDREDMREILPSDIKLQNFQQKPIGVHTYSLTDGYEIIDIEYLKWDYMKWIRRIIHK